MVSCCSLRTTGLKQNGLHLGLALNAAGEGVGLYMESRSWGGDGRSSLQVTHTSESSAATELPLQPELLQAISRGSKS